MFKKLIGLLVLMFLMAIAIPVLAQRYDSCERRGRGNAYGHQKHRYDRDRRYAGYYGQDYGRRNRRSNYYYGGNNGGYYSPSYYPQTYYQPGYYVVRRRPAYRIYNYNNYGYPQRYRRGNRGRISFSIGF